MMQNTDVSQHITPLPLNMFCLRHCNLMIFRLGHTVSRTSIKKFGSVLMFPILLGLLDETAIFGRGCRREFPKNFLNLKHGER